MSKISKLVVWPSLLSLDAPLIAVLWQLLFARSLHMRLPTSATVVLGLVLWLIYVGDRILDSFRLPQADDAVRHQFFRAHRMAYALPFCAALTAASWIAWRYLRPDVRRDGLALGAVVIFYFAAVHLLPENARRWFPKELAVALVFAVGTCLPVSVRLRGAIAPPFELTFLLFALVLWMNALFIEYSEWVRLRGRRSDRPNPLTLVAGKHFRLVTAAIGVAALLAMLDRTFRVERPVLVAEVLSVLALQGIDIFRASVPVEVVGAAADAALLAPGLLLIFLSR